MSAINKVMVVGGGGQMGNGIGQVAATAGLDVTLVDLSQSELDRGLKRIERSLERMVRSGSITDAEAQASRDRVSTSTDLEATARETDHAVETVVEDIGVKRDIFGRLDAACRPDVILASNTSQFAISQIAGATGRPDRVIGTHWFNPPPVMRLIEIVRGVETSDQTLAEMQKLAERYGKETIVCQKDTQGFLTSRLIMILVVEAMRIVEEGIATPEDVNQACKLAFNHAMGPLETADLGGLDTFVKASAAMTEHYGDRFRATQGLRALVNAGHYGYKTGRGFSDYGEAR
jgi:3-hydroxybutyryl-CoA dehydrogenase